MAASGKIDPTVPLPPQLEPGHIKRAVDYIEKELSGLVDLYFEQANVFSAVVGIFGTKALDSFSTYEKHRNLDTAQQRFPDLKLRGSGSSPAPKHCLESKGSKRPWAIQSHYDHEGWYVVWRYLVDETESIEPGRPVVVWRVDVVYLAREDWKYERSSAGHEGGGRTHTFGVRKAAAKLKGKAVYFRDDIVLKASKPVPKNGE